MRLHPFDRPDRGMSSGRLSCSVTAVYCMLCKVRVWALNSSPGVATPGLGQLAWDRLVLTKNLPILGEHGGAETGLGTEKPMVKPLSKLLRQHSLPVPEHFQEPQVRVSRGYYLASLSLETVIHFFHY